jgi:hypothetical protein
MGMCRVVLNDGTVMHLEAVRVGLDEGHLRIFGNEKGGQRGVFAPGVWRYWIWVTMADAA